MLGLRNGNFQEGIKAADLDLVGLDLAMNAFQLHGCSSTGEVVLRGGLKPRTTSLRKQFRRSELLSFIADLPTCTIAMEACSGSYFGVVNLRHLAIRFA